MIPLQDKQQTNNKEMYYSANRCWKAEMSKTAKVLVRKRNNYSAYTYFSFKKALLGENIELLEIPATLKEVTFHT